MSALLVDLLICVDGAWNYYTLNNPHFLSEFLPPFGGIVLYDIRAYELVLQYHYYI